MTTTHTVRPLPLNTIVMVSGVSFRQDAVRQVVEFDEVRIAHDRSNAFDEFACTVSTLGGTQLGFIPRELAERLTRPHPGGVWRGRVEDVLRNDTWGLRVRVGPLLATGDRDVGQSAGGLRHRGDGVIVADNGAVAVEHSVTGAPTDEPGTPEPARRVYARSGRLLGDLVDVEGSVVHVRTVAGLNARYPHAVVEVRSD